MAGKIVSCSGLSDIPDESRQAHSRSCGGLLGQILRSLVLVHLHQHLLLLRQVLLNVSDFPWRYFYVNFENELNIPSLPVPMVPPWSLMVKCCPASRTIGFSNLVKCNEIINPGCSWDFEIFLTLYFLHLNCIVASSPGIAISLPSSSTKAAQSHVFEKHTWG